MTSKAAQRTVLTLFVAIGLSAVGVLAGFLLGRKIAIEMTEPKLIQYASNIMNTSEGSSLESRQRLAELNTSPDPCSEKELLHLKQLVFHAEYLKEAGHTQNGEIICSATFGRLKAPLPLPQANFSQRDGTKVFTNLPYFRMGDFTVITLELNNSFVVFNPHILQHLHPTSLHFTVLAIDEITGKPGIVLGEEPRVPLEKLLAINHARFGDSLYATRCSARFFNCMVAFTTIEEVVQSNRGTLFGYEAMGGVIGMGSGLLFSMLHFRKHTLEQQLQRAIRRNKLRVVYQPIIDLATGQTVGAEALVRWTDEEGRARNPEMFIKLAEENGFITSITRLVLRHSLADLRDLLRSDPDFRVNINISALDLSNPAFLPMVETCLREAAVSAENVAIELTESATALRSVAIGALNKLHERGHHICIDDFGTGYSSLSYLHELAVDTIKIDKAFTRSIGTQSVVIEILPQILNMAKTLNLDVVIEGIETEAQVEYFDGRHPNLRAQGWLFGRPIPADEFLLRYFESKEELVHSV